VLNEIFYLLFLSVSKHHTVLEEKKRCFDRY